MVAAVGTGVLAFAEASSPVYTWPSSPGVNERVEQKPSEDDISSVRPSLDHVKSVNVAKCKLLTMHNGVVC